MNAKRKKRLILACALLGICATAVALVLFALQTDINHYYSLESVAKGEAPIQQDGIRIGGLVVNGSFERVPDSLQVRFQLSDGLNPEVHVDYEGILPDLFREGQGIIATGRLHDKRHFQASSILAKHDENYMPPELKNDLDRAGHSAAIAAKAEGTR